MAKDLNKTRIRDSKIALLVTVLIVLFTRAFFEVDGTPHEILDYSGYFLVAVCALGRLYSTAFLGGFKNETLITYGAFSVVRNPLYFFSLIGITGIAFLSTHIVVIVGLPVFFIALYHALISREEKFLEEQFGDDYRAYKKRVPRLLPNLCKYQAPDSIEVVPQYLNNAFKDAIWWFLPFPVFELVEYLQEVGFIKQFILIP